MFEKHYELSAVSQLLVDLHSAVADERLSTMDLLHEISTLQEFVAEASTKALEEALNK